MATAVITISNCKKCPCYSTISFVPQCKTAICEQIGKRIQIEVKKGKKIKIPQWCPNKVD